MKIDNDTDLSIYKIISLEGHTYYIVAVNFIDLQTDIIQTKISPKSIELLDFSVFCTKEVLGLTK